MVAHGADAVGLSWLMGGMAFILLAMVTRIVPLIFFWLIFDKAGFPGPLALVALIPLGTIVLLGVLAFAEWPVLKEAGSVPAEESPAPNVY